MSTTPIRFEMSTDFGVIAVNQLPTTDWTIVFVCVHDANIVIRDEKNMNDPFAAPDYRVYYAGRRTRFSATLIPPRLPPPPPH